MSSRKSQLSHPTPPPSPTFDMQVPFSGLPLAPTGMSGSIPLIASAAETFGVLSFRTIGLKLTLTELVREVLLAEEVDEAGEALRRALVEVAADRDAGASGDAPDVLDEAIERALTAAQRPHPVVRVAVAVERNLDAPQPVRQQPIDHVRCQQQPVRDDADRHRHAARLRAAPELLGQVVHHRQVEKRLAAEERQLEGFGVHAIELALDPLGDLRRRLERHLVGELVVIAVIALETVIAGEVALERRQQRHAQLVRCRS